MTCALWASTGEIICTISTIIPALPIHNDTALLVFGTAENYMVVRSQSNPNGTMNSCVLLGVTLYVDMRYIAGVSGNRAAVSMTHFCSIDKAFIRKNKRLLVLPMNGSICMTRDQFGLGLTF